MTGYSSVSPAFARTIATKKLAPGKSELFWGKLSRKTLPWSWRTNTKKRYWVHRGGGKPRKGGDHERKGRSSRPEATVRKWEGKNFGGWGGGW